MQLNWGYFILLNCLKITCVAMPLQWEARAREGIEEWSAQRLGSVFVGNWWQPGRQTSQLSGLRLEAKVIGTDGFWSLFQRIVCIFYQFNILLFRYRGCNVILFCNYGITRLKKKTLKKTRHWANLANKLGGRDWRFTELLSYDRPYSRYSCLLVSSPAHRDNLVSLSLCLQV